ncbi:MAG TPA: hypothetical protein VFR01_06375 [Geobacterales bacterium]|nr:hypothetical protein [Geobacterales bacterium]
MSGMVPFDEEGQEKLTRAIKGFSIYLLSGGAAFSVEIMVFILKGWEEGVRWWLTTFPLFSIWLLAPFSILSYLILKGRNSFRQLVLLFFGAVGTTFFALFIFLDAFFIHYDPRSWIVLLIVPGYQFVAIGSLAALRYAIRDK